MAALATLADNFNDGVQDAQWTNAVDLTDGVFSATTTCVEGSNVLTITPPSLNASTLYNGYQSVSTYDFTNSVAQVEVPGVGSSGGSVQMWFMVGIDGGNRIGFLTDGGTILGRYTVPGTNTDIYSATYNATTHRWLRVRHGTWDAGALAHVASHTYWDSSTDGVTWTNRADLASTPITITALKLDLSGGSYASVASPGTIIFDNLNQFGSSLPPGLGPVVGMNAEQLATQSTLMR